MSATDATICGMAGVPGGSTQRPAVFFAAPADFREWLEEHHATKTELWMELRKKDVADRGMTWEQAVEEALCFGWIDSVAQGIDTERRRQRWTPRKPGSNWSAINVALMARLTDEGRMTPAGTAIFEVRKPEREAVYAYEHEEFSELPPEYAALLAADPVASAWFEQATPSYRRTAVHWVLSAKREATRESRLAELIEDSRSGRLIRPQRYGTPPAWVGKNRAALGID